MRPIWKEFIKTYQTVLSPQIFASRGRAILGEKWAPYSPAYLAKRKAEGFGGGQMLVLSGRMRDATYGGPGWYQKLAKDRMTMGVKVPPYWRAQQFGYKPRKLPARPYFMTDDYSPRAYTYLIKIANEEIKRMTEKDGK